MTYLYFFLTFFQIGLFGFGGGCGMLSLIRTETVIYHHWLNSAELTNIVAISQTASGPIGINSATYCGYAAVHNAGYGMPMAILGSATTTFASVLPSLILMTLISKTFTKYMNTEPVQNVFSGLRFAVVGLLGTAILLLMNEENPGSMIENQWQLWISMALLCVTFIGTRYMKVNPTRMICYAVFAGLISLY